MLYSEKVKAKDANFSRKYGLDIDEDDLNAPGFAVIVEVTSAKTHTTQVYKISSHRSVTAKYSGSKIVTGPDHVPIEYYKTCLPDDFSPAGLSLNNHFYIMPLQKSNHTQVML